MMGMGMGVGFSSSPPWTPAALGSTVEARWESDAGITLTSGRVSGWNDLKNAHHWAQGTALKRPVVEDSVFGSAKGLRFTAVNEEHLALSAGALVSPAAAHAFLIVKIATDPPTLAKNAGLWSFGSCADQSHYPWTGTDTIFEQFGSGNRVAFSKGAVPLTSARCYEVVSTAAIYEQLLDGVSLCVAGGNVGWNAVEQRIGASNASTYCLDGWIGALIICNAKLTGSDLTSMRAYLASKYGVTFA